MGEPQVWEDDEEEEEEEAEARQDMDINPMATSKEGLVTATVTVDGDSREERSEIAQRVIGRAGWGAVESPLKGTMPFVFLNSGGGFKPYTKGGDVRKDSNLETMTKLVVAREVDFAASVEARVTMEDSAAILDYARRSGLKAVVAPTSRAAARALGEVNEKGGADPAAGIVMVMSNALFERMRGRPETSISGRLLHVQFGDGATPAKDKTPLHVIVAYGVSSQSEKSGARAAMAVALAREMREILSREAYREHNFLVYADANAVLSGADRSTGSKLPYDDSPNAVCKVMVDERFGLVDVMRSKYNGNLPMTYWKDGRANSRIDLLVASKRLLATMYAATAAGTGSLSKTHAVLGGSFQVSPVGQEAPDRTATSSREAAVAVMAQCGGRRFHLTGEALRRYQEETFKEHEVADLIKKAKSKHNEVVERAQSEEDEGLKESTRRNGQQQLYCNLTKAILFAEDVSRCPEQKRGELGKRGKSRNDEKEVGGLMRVVETATAALEVCNEGHA